MNPLWFNESVYMLNKFDQLQAQGSEISTMQDLRAAFLDANLTPYEHYQQFGDAEGLNPNSYFNRAEYMQAKANQLNRIKEGDKDTWDVEAVQKAFTDAGITAGEHFGTYGWLENVNPSNSFDVSNYLEAKAAQMGNGYTVSEVKKDFMQQGADPVGHYMVYGAREGLRTSAVPAGERVADDPSLPRETLLSADGKTITIHMQSPVVANSIEKEDFSVWLGNRELAVSKVAAGGDKASYDLIVTLAEESRVPGLGSRELDALRVAYDPAGGNKVELTTDLGRVPAFERPVVNQSQCFEIIERVSTETKTITVPGVPPAGGGVTPPDTTTEITLSTLNITITTPSNYVATGEVTQFVKVDLTSAAGVVTGGSHGIITAPRLMDGKLVQKLDTTGVSDKVHLDIIAGADGTEITTGNGADKITLGAGVDKVNYTTLESSQLSHMETIDKFDVAADTLFFGDATAATPTPLINSVIFKGPLSLEAQITEASIQGVFNGVAMLAKTAYLLQNGKEFLLVADANGDGVFTTADFAVQLTGVTGLPEGTVPGTEMNAFFL